MSTSPILLVPAGRADAISTSPILLVPAGNEATISTCISVPLIAPAKELVSASIVVKRLLPAVCSTEVAAPEGKAELETSTATSPVESVFMALTLAPS